MKLTKGTKPQPIIPENLKPLKHKCSITGTYIEIETEETQLITYLKSKGFK